MEYRVAPDQGIFVFSPRNPPVLTVNSGDQVVFETRDAFSGQIRSADDSPVNLDFARVNAASGPVRISDARVGAALKVEILDVLLDPVGYQCIVPGFGVLKDRFTQPVTRACPVRDGWVWVGQHQVPANPNIGTIGVAPPGAAIPSIQPGDHGGNLDAREIGTGSTLFLPILVEGALLAMGDVHAVQGDGEVCGVAVEIGAAITVRLSTVDWNIRRPLVVTNTSLITLASAPTVDEAMVMATNDMVDLLTAAGMDSEEAYMYLTLVGHLGLAQIVNPWKTAKVAVPLPSSLPL